MLITELESQHLRVVLEEMCARVEIDPGTIDIEQDNWWRKTTWTYQEQASFVDWLCDYLADPRVARELLELPRLAKNKQQRRKVANEFLLNYGWLVKEG